MKDFRDLKVWRRAHSVTLAIYECTKEFPREETYGMVNQLRRCAASVAANIAEGCGRIGNPEFGRFSRDGYGVGQRIGVLSSACA